MAVLMFLVVCLLWGHSFLLMKLAEPVFGALGVGAWRQVMGAATLGLIWLAGRGGRPVRGSDLPAVGLLAAVGYALPFALQPYVIGQVERYAGHGSAFGGMIVGFVPLMTLVVSVPMLGRYPTARQVVGVVGGLAFLALLFGEELRAGVPAWLVGLAMCTPLGYATANTLVKRRFGHVRPMGLAMAALAVASVYLVPAAVWSGRPETGQRFWPALGALAVLGVACSGLALAMFYRLIQLRGPLYAGMVTYVIPCVAMAVGWLGGERLSLVQLAAMAGVLAMVALVQSAGGGRPGRPPAHKRPAGRACGQDGSRPGTRPADGA